MSTLLRIDTSIRTEGSVTREVTDTVEGAWLRGHPDGVVVRRDLATDPVPAGVWSTAAIAARTPQDERSAGQVAALEIAAATADDLLNADALVVAAPLYNFGVPAHLKTWIDLVLTDPRFAPGTAALAGRSVVIVIARGGAYGPGTPRAGWDHATPYLQQIFGAALGAEVTVIDAELTMAEANPAMAQLRPLAAESRARAFELAERAGAELATVGTAL